MAPTFTIFQDPPCTSASAAYAPSSKPLSSVSSSSRSLGRSASRSVSLLALDADKENVNPTTGLSRAGLAKPKSKKALSSKNKDSTSKALSKASKTSRGNSTNPSPAKSGKGARTAPYPDPVVPSSVSELSFGSSDSPQPVAPCLITGFSASSLSDFAEPDFDLHSDFIQQSSPTRPMPTAAPNSLWTPAIPYVVETDGDRKARDLTELPLADLSEAFTTGISDSAKKPTSQNKLPAPNEPRLSLLGESIVCLSPMFLTTPRFEQQRALIADFDSNLSVF
ncbi:hypothetical protein CTheo_2280 [Ceratobasidium theobromae]|uniref:Uncharacterized protein n=1 Tax=Ceratobasidium theobromae TaxID=1582974 RepID=A0A5N5QRH5_9AGAM|nr:hypothetical protein CTheo_2280 [Ceratobasidium theobromae]